MFYVIVTSNICGEHIIWPEHSYLALFPIHRHRCRHLQIMCRKWMPQANGFRRGRRNREYWAMQALGMMANVPFKKCAGVGCAMRPSYGVAASKKAEYCSRSTLWMGWLDVYSKKCAGNGCSKQPSYGVAGSKKAEYCVRSTLWRGWSTSIPRECAGRWMF